MITLWRVLHGRQPVAAVAGHVALWVLVACGAAMGLDPREFQGTTVWAKPAKFALSFIVWFWTLAWLWPALGRGWEERLGRALLWLMIGIALFEQGWIMWRAATGGASHFATDPLGAVVYGLMGLAATLLVAAAALTGLLILWRREPALPLTWRLGAGLGLLLGGVMAGLTGFAIGANGSPWVGGAGGQAESWPVFLWSREAGDLRVAHFLGLHAMQALPLLAWLVPRPIVILGGSFAWCALVLAVFLQAKAGLPLV